MSKTFKGSRQGNDERTLEVDTLFGDARLLLRAPDGVKLGIALDKDDAPALALAILEAAGAHKESQDFLGGAVEQLKFHIGEQERATAEAKEREELEAEALAFYLAYIEATGVNSAADSFDDLNSIAKEQWLAVARKARELAKEAAK